MHDDRNTLTTTERRVLWLLYVLTLAMFAFVTGAALALGRLPL